jgi:hypothetical protein
VFELIFGFLKFGVKLTIAVVLSATTIALGPWPEVALNFLESLYNTYKLIKATRQFIQDYLNYKRIKSSFDNFDQLVSANMQFQKCQAMGFLYSQFSSQEKNVQGLEEIMNSKIPPTEKDDGDKNLGSHDNRVKVRNLSKELLFDYIKGLCYNDVNICTASFSQDYLEGLFGGERQKEISTISSYLSQKGPISAVAVPGSNVERSLLMSMGKKKRIF